MNLLLQPGENLYLQSCQYQVKQRNRDQHFPGKVEQLVKLGARIGPANPDNGKDQGIEFKKEPEQSPDNAEKAGRIKRDWRLPAAQEKYGCQGTANWHIRP